MSQVAQLFSIKATKQLGLESEADSSITSTWQVHDLAILDALLIEYQDLFVEPKTLPRKDLWITPYPFYLMLNQ